MIPFRPEQVGKAEEKEEGAKPAPLLSGLPLRRIRPRLHVEVRCRSRPANDSTLFAQRSKPVAILSGPWKGAIQASLGPWRSSGNWWEKALLWRSEEWDIVLENGGMCRISRDRKEWFVEGVYG